MHILTWLDKNVNNINQDPLFIKYFGSKSIEKGIDVYWLFNPELGIDLIMREDYFIKSIHFFSGSQNDSRQFTDPLPLDLDFSFSRKKTRALLGEPDSIGGGGFSFLYGITPPWDKYLFDNYALHLQFSESEDEIDLITIGSPPAISN